MINVLASFRPTVCKKIITGEVNTVIRHSRPVIKEKEFKMLIYCTVGRLKLVSVDEVDYDGNKLEKKAFIKVRETSSGYCEEGTVIGECIVDGVLKIEVREGYFKVETTELLQGWKIRESVKDIENYLNGKPGYMWNLKDFKKYDEPKEVYEFAIKAPRSWMYAGGE